ncbi:hypothetical protein [Streptomyces sp. TLI_146]|uniref:hypothetical protein n=1 Tax=Streptomyces sp. TLI_146 TaxID=1938858 RepID=UPI000CBBEB1D|nr:hypothetical protein [Streptomyces sp. TLI_146]PKV82582.1 hypothetical protein BX283_0015 [Streptomyces sp. TLI_146]
MTDHKNPRDGFVRPEEDGVDTMLQALLDREECRLLASASTVPDGIDEWRALVAEPGFVRRSAVLARGAPLHRIDQRQAWQRFPGGLYDPRTLALAGLEAVVSRQEMEAEATTEEVIEFLTGLAASEAPGRPASEHLAVARFVLRELLNDAQHGEEFEVCYSDFRKGHQRVPLSLRMLEEGIGRRGQGVVRATPVAINLLLSGLEHDLEDEQAARDAMLRRQVASGRWGRAEESAAESLKLSLVYCERVRAVLAETERDVRSVDWSQDVPALLHACRQHLGERHRVERELMDYMREIRNDVEDAHVRRTCERVLRLLGRAHLRHTQLLAKVIDARPAFLRSQAQQRFRPPPRLALVGVQEDVLEPLLRLDVEDAEAIASLFANEVGGPVVARQPRLRDWWESLLAPARDPQQAVPRRRSSWSPTTPVTCPSTARTTSLPPAACSWSPCVLRCGCHSCSSGRWPTRWRRPICWPSPRCGPMPPIPRSASRTRWWTSWRTCSMSTWWWSTTAASSISARSPAVTCCSSRSSP